MVKKSDYATENASIKNDTNATLDSKINDLKAQHIADEVKKFDDKIKKNAGDILGFESRLKQKEDIVDEVQRENSFTRGFYYYLQQSYLVYKFKNYPFKKDTSGKLITWKSTGIDNLSTNSGMNAVSDSRLDLLKITKNATDSSKNKYEGYGICFDEGGKFTKRNITNGKNIIIFGSDMSFSIHANNRANNIYVLGDLLVQGINGTSIYAEKIYKTNFTAVEKKFVLSLH